MPETPTTYNYYPALSGLITLEDLPEILDFIKEGLQEIFDKVYYKDFQSSRNVSGSGAFYSLDIVSRGRLDLEFPGTGIFIILNPDYEDSTISSFPIQLYWEWEIMRFVSYFNANQFSFSVEGFYDLALQIFNVSEAQTLELATSTFVAISVPGISKFQQLINDVNSLYASSISINENSATRYQELVIEIDLIGQHAFPTIFALYLFSNDAQTAKNNLNYFFSTFLPTDVESYIKGLILPRARATLALSAAIEFPRNMLTPVYPEGTVIGGQDVSYQPIPEPAKAMFSFAEALFYADTTQGFGYEMDLSLSTVTPVQIGNTGLILNIHNLKIDLSTTNNFPEADADGRPLEFMGVYTEQVDILLPSNWFTKDDGVIQTLKISGKHLLIGTGGISGIIALETIDTGNPPGATDFFWVNLGTDPNTAWKIGFHSFDLTLSQGDIVSSNIVAGLKIPKFTKSNGDPAIIEVHGHLESSGDFLLTASAVPPFDPKITWPGVFTLHLKSVELGKEGDDFFIGATAEIEFLDFLGDLLEGQTISISALRIYSDGRIDFRVNGGNLTLPKPIKLKIGPTVLSVTAIHFGSHEREYKGKIRKYNYFGFDGGVSIGVAGIDARGDGIKYYYTIDDDEAAGKEHDSYLHIQTIHIDMVIPANSDDPSIAIKGWLTIPEPGDPLQEYQGGVDLKIKKPRINGKVDMRLAPKYPAFLIDAAIELPNPIALGPVSIYGFRGLLGYRYVAEKKAIGMNETNTWYQYYTAPERGVNVHKFSRPDQTEEYGFPFSLGVGAIIGDTAAMGTIISANAMLLLSLPSMVMVDARMKLLSKRVSFSDDPPFFAFFIFGDNSLEFGFGADYKFPEDSGDIIKLYAEIQAGFNFNNPSAWYINFGTEQQPITAKLLMELFTLKAYLMISGKGIKAGARGEFRFDRKFGPVSIFVLAYLELGGRISFQKPQMGAYIEAGLAIDINVKIFRIYIAVTILLAVESPKPFLIYGRFTVEFKIKVLFFKIKFKAQIELKWEFNKQVDRTPISPFTEVTDQLDGLVKGISMLTNETFDLVRFNDPNSINPNEITKVVPLDTYIDIKTTKGLLPNTATNNIIGGYSNPAGSYTDLIPPEKVMKGLELRQVKHQYSVESIEIKAYSELTGQWKDYNPYVALYPEDANAFAGLKVGQWQKKDDQYNAIRLLATTPFSYTEQGNPGWFIPEQYGIIATTLFCQGQNIEHSVSDFLDKPLNTAYYASTSNFFQSKGASYQLQGDVQYIVNPDGSVTMQGDYAIVSDEPNVFGFAKSLEFPNKTPLIIMLPASSVDIKLQLSTYSTGLTVAFYAKDPDSPIYNPQYNNLYEVYKTKDELVNPVTFPEPNTIPNVQQGVTKIVITPDTSDIAAINQILEQMAILMDEGYQIALAQGGAIDNVQPSNPELYNDLEKRLIRLQSVGCEGAETEYYEIACKIYSDLIGYYNNNFNQDYPYGGDQPDPETLKEVYANFIKSNLDIYAGVLTIISGSGIDSQLFRLYTRSYAFYLGDLDAYIQNNPDDFDGIIFRFEILKAKFKQILEWLSNVRPCEDQVLCDLADYLSYQDYGHFSDKPPVSVSPLLDAYYQFIKENPTYRYLNTILNRQIYYIQSIVNGGWTGYIMNETTFDAACDDLIAIIKDLGNCKENKKCFTLFHDISWLTVENYTYNINIPQQGAIQSDAEAAVASITKSIQPIWRPDTKYYVKFILKDTVDNGQGVQNYPYAYGFRTAGPLGFFHLDRQSDYGDIPIVNSSNVLEDTTGILRDQNWNTISQETPHPDLYPHTNLRNYIDYERSYPNADGNIVNAKPLFYYDDTTKIRLYFNKTYISKLLEGWDAIKDINGNEIFPELGGTMKIIIKDPVEGTEIINPPSLDTVVEDIEIPQTVESWEPDDNPPVPPIYNQYFNMLLNNTCVGDIELIKPKSNYRIVTPKKLKPQKLYTVQVLNFYWGQEAFDITNITEENKAKFTKEVHKFVFQTSRYSNFDEQVNSCFIPYTDENGDSQEKQAVYPMEKAIEPAKIQAAFDTVMGQTNSLSDQISLQFQHPFDRIMEGLFGFAPLEDPVTTEFNKIIDLNTGRVVALLIRNPEPFNHPKIPLQEVNRNGIKPGMIEVMRGGLGTPVMDQNFHFLYSKDFAKAIVMRDGLWIKSLELDFQFIYKIWNGSEYENSSLISVDNIKIN